MSTLGERGKSHPDFRLVVTGHAAILLSLINQAQLGLANRVNRTGALSTHPMATALRSLPSPNLYSSQRAAWLMCVLFTLIGVLSTEVQGQSPIRPGSAARGDWTRQAIQESSSVPQGPDWIHSSWDPFGDPPSGLEFAIASISADRNSIPGSTLRNDSPALRRHKQGFFQRLSISAEWAPRFGDTSLGVTYLKTSTTVAVPLGSFQNLLLVTPGFEVGLIDAASTVDIPNQLYHADVDFMWRKELTERWGAMIGVTPGYSSDFQSSTGAIRIRGRGFATWEWVPDQLTLLVGAVYLDRNDLPLLPGVGLTWTPTPDWRLELMFPRPKLAYRIEFVPGEHEQWVHLSGHLGGRTWAVERIGGGADELTLRDFGLTLGWERIVDGGGGVFAEVGWSFGREMEYESVPFTQSFDDAVFLRGGITF
jgi:hypothetical protein